MKTNFRLVIISILLFIGFVALTSRVTAQNSNQITGSISKLYPNSKQTIDSKIQSFLATKADSSKNQDLQDAVNELNIYRFLCGVTNSNVKLDTTMTSKAQKAAEACKKAGKISHDLGNFTNQSNLYANSAKITKSATSIHCYMDDPGANNRERRGHRLWCLNPALRRTGIGVTDNYSAMLVICKGNGTGRTPHSYPGRGFYPKKYMLGNGWSYHSSKITKNLKPNIKIWQLTTRPAQAFKLNKVEGKTIKINKVFYHDGAIVFEPQIPKPEGLYWIQISHEDELLDGYIVEFY